MTEKNPPPKARGFLTALIRGLILASMLGAAFWLGAKALQEAPEPAGPQAGPPGGAQGPPPASVFVDDVIEVRARETHRVTGSLRAVARAQVAARESGAIAEILADEGDLVRQDDPLAILDRRRIDAEIAEAEAAITAAEVLVTQREAESKRALSDFDMKTKLFQKRAVSERELLDAERERLVAAAQVKAASDQLNVAKSRLSLLRVREADLRILAPFDGRIVERHVEPGEWLAAGAPVVTLVSTGKIEAWLDVPERFAATIPAEPTAFQIFVKGGRLSARAESVKTIAEVDMRSRLFNVVATIDDLDGRFVHGMSVHTDLPIGVEEPMLTAPVDAIISTRLGDFVYRSQESTDSGQDLPTAERVAVTVRFRRDGKAFLEPGMLSAGDQVVVEGNERLREGQALLISRDPRSPADASQLSVNH